MEAHVDEASHYLPQNQPEAAMIKLALCLLCLQGAYALDLVTTATAQQVQLPPSGIPVSVTLGVEVDGAAMDAWINAIRVWHDNDTLQVILRNQHALSNEEAEWATLIRSRAAAWSIMTDSLRMPFEATAPPDTVYILLGNVGGQDAFTFSDSTIGFDLHRLSAQYGAASMRENENRIDRFFAHEFTHLLHKAWRNTHGVVLTSPLDRALWECLVEGMGNYRSLSERWVGPGGEITPHAHAVLERLQPVFVERIAALEYATEGEAPFLMAGLSSGPFDQKWGALTVALWLAQEASGDDRRLRRWVEAGPQGILTLARLYLSEDVRGKLPHPRK